MEVKQRLQFELLIIWVVTTFVLLTLLVLLELLLIVTGEKVILTKNCDQYHKCMRVIMGSLIVLMESF